MWCWICFGKSFTDSHASKCELCTKKGCNPKNGPCKTLFECLEVKLMVCLKKKVDAAIPTTVFVIKTYWMYLRETFWLCLVVMVRMYICRAANRNAASYFNSGPNRSSTTSLQLYKGEGRGQTSWRSRRLFQGFIFPVSKSHSRGSPQSRAKVFATSVAGDSFKGVLFSDPCCMTPRLKMVKSDVKSWLAFFSIGLIIKDPPPRKQSIII